MTTERIDVLAVMQEAAYGLALADERSYGAGDELLNARAAVAELIEACRPAASEDGWDDAGYTRFCAALARCGGAK